MLARDYYEALKRSKYAWYCVGALALAWFVLRLWIAPRREPLIVGQEAEHGEQ